MIQASEETLDDDEAQRQEGGADLATRKRMEASALSNLRLTIDEVGDLSELHALLFERSDSHR